MKSITDFSHGIQSLEKDIFYPKLPYFTIKDCLNRSYRKKVTEELFNPSFVDETINKN